jgi:hypothetical protein
MSTHKLEDADLRFEPISIPSDAFDPGDIDYSDPVAVKAALEQTTVGCLFTDQGLASICRQGHARELFATSAPKDANDPHLVSLRDWIEPSVGHLWEVDDLELRALLIIATAVHGTDEARRKLIVSVKDAGIFSVLAQANLREPEPTRRRSWPWWYRPWRRYRSPDIMPSLFTLCGEG